MSSELYVNKITGTSGTSGGAPITLSGDTVVLPVNANKGVSATTVISGTSHYDRIKITADYLTLTTSQNNSILISSVDVTAIITNSGANGLDTGSVAASNWYYYWVISNGTTTAGLWSLSNSSPTMPSGYIYKKFMGAVYNQSSGGSNNAHLCEVHQKGGWIYTFYGSSTPGYSGNRIFNASSMGAHTQTEVNPTTFIPPNVDYYHFRCQADTVSVVSVNIHFNSGVFTRDGGTEGGDGIGNQQLYIYTNSNSSTQVGGNIILPIFTPQKFFCNAVYSVGTVNIYHVGYQYLGII
tara:strand:- start:938 stop:1822 length:885 start_codon:yes stop_codon:yes gene_type:complete